MRELLSDLIPTACTVETQHGPIIIPDDFHHGLIMLLHVAGHMINDGGVGLRHLCDWAVYVNRVDVEKFKPQLESVGLWTFACQLTAVCVQYLDLPEMDWVGEQDDEFLSSLIEDVLSAGNFGKKETDRQEDYAGIEEVFFCGDYKSPIPTGDRLLLPVYMIVNVVCYSGLLITGKRRVIKLSTFAIAKNRAKLYRQFRLFEV